MILIGPLAIGLGVGALGVAGSLLSGAQGNKARRDEAARNRAFQERMRNTEYQAAVTDMEAAGLNPALAYQQGGASSPSGSLAQQSNIAEGAVGESATSALAVKRQTAELKLLKATTEKAERDAMTARSTQNVAKYDEEMSLGKYLYYFDRHGRPKQALQDLLSSEHGITLANSARSISEASIANFSIAEQRAISELFEKIGRGGAGARTAMPLILQLLRGRR